MIRIKQRVYGSPDHIRAFWYEEGKTYGPTTSPRTSESLERVLVEGGLAEYVEERKVQPADYETKVSNPTADEDFEAGAFTVAEVLELVEGGTVSREVALASEQAGKARKGLLDALAEE